MIDEREYQSVVSSLYQRGFRRLLSDSSPELIVRRPVVVQKAGRKPCLSIDILTGEDYSGKVVATNAKMCLYSHTLGVRLGVFRFAIRHRDACISDRRIYNQEVSLCTEIAEGSFNWACLPPPVLDHIPMMLRISRRNQKTEQGMVLPAIKQLQKGAYYFVGYDNDWGIANKVTALEHSTKNFLHERYKIMASPRMPNTNIAVQSRPLNFESGDFALYFNDYDPDGTTAQDDKGSPFLVVYMGQTAEGFAMIAQSRNEDIAAFDEDDPDTYVLVPEDYLYPVDRDILDVVYPSEKEAQKKAQEDIRRLADLGQTVPIQFRPDNTVDWVSMHESYIRSVSQSPAGVVVAEPEVVSSAEVKSKVAPTKKPVETVTSKSEARNRKIQKQYNDLAEDDKVMLAAVAENSHETFLVGAEKCEGFGVDSLESLEQSSIAALLKCGFIQLFTSNSKAKFVRTTPSGEQALDL